MYVGWKVFCVEDGASELKDQESVMEEFDDKDRKWNPVLEDGMGSSFLFQLSLWKCHPCRKPRERWCFWRVFRTFSPAVRVGLIVGGSEEHIKPRLSGVSARQGLGLAGPVWIISKQGLGHFASACKDLAFHQSQSRNKRPLSLPDKEKSGSRKTLDSSLRWPGAKLEVP